MSADPHFTGERLHAGDALFALDMARHAAAYEFARSALPSGRVLDLGCGSGHGTATLAGPGRAVVGFDRVRPDRASRREGAHFVRGTLERLPLRPASFELIMSFQVIEHLEDPTPYLEAIARLLAPGGKALITTPNLLMSDGVNPYHVHEYRSEEFGDRLRDHFAEVELLGIGASEPVRRVLEARSQRIRRIMRLDPLRLRDRMPRPLVEWLFARFAVAVRRRAGGDASAPPPSWRDFPVGAADPRCLDLLAVCRGPL